LNCLWISIPFIDLRKGYSFIMVTMPTRHAINSLTSSARAFNVYPRPSLPALTPSLRKDVFQRIHFAGINPTAPADHTPHILQKLNSVPKKILMFDLDGTLMEEDREPPVPIPMATEDMDALFRLAQRPDTRVVINSARLVSELLEFLPPLKHNKLPIVLVGLMNGEIYDCASQTWLKQPASEYINTVQSLKQEMVQNNWLESAPTPHSPNYYHIKNASGAYLEDKGCGLCLHYQPMLDNGQNPQPLIDEFKQKIDVLMAAHPGLFQFSKGYNVVELLPREYNKGQAVTDIKRHANDQLSEGEAPYHFAFIGNSGGDGPGFEAVHALEKEYQDTPDTVNHAGGTSILVGPSPIKTHYNVPKPSDLHQLIKMLIGIVAQ
jgi:trehalose-phosphatase